jgi:hypothetical protein
MRLLRVTLGFAVALVGCQRPKPSPLAGVGSVTSARIVVLSGKAGSVERIVRDTAVLRALAHLGSRDGDWHHIQDTPPAGEVRAVLFRDTTYLGVVSFGPNFVGARSPRTEEYRTLEDSERVRVRALLSRAGA